MKKILVFLFAAFLPVSVMAAGGPGPELRHFEADFNDKASLQRGAALVTNYCMGCHSLKYSRHERVATDLGIPPSLYEENLIFGDQKIGDLMEIAMSSEDASQWFGIEPPDLTMVTRVRGADWVFSYLTGFYLDPARPWGVNNTIFKDVGMPNVLAELQGDQVLGCKPVAVGTDALSGKPLMDESCGHPVPVEGTGTLSEAEFDQVAADITNYLNYTAEPMKQDRQRIGFYVLMFLGVFFVFVYLLNREYWKDVH